MKVFRKRRPRLGEVKYWPLPYRQDGKNLFFKCRISGHNLRFSAYKSTGKITISPNDFAKLFGFKKMAEMEAYIQKKGGAL